MAKLIQWLSRAQAFMGGMGSVLILLPTQPASAQGSSNDLGRYFNAVGNDLKKSALDFAVQNGITVQVDQGGQLWLPGMK
jgi:hypothetical protein